MVSRLSFHPLRFAFTAQDEIYFPAGKSANVLRGAFGTIFRKIACQADCESARLCPMHGACPYAQMFEPLAGDGAPSGLSDLPRPFVFRAWHLDGKTIAPGEGFHFDLNLFDLRASSIQYLMSAFAQFACEGLGARRSRVKLESAWQLGLDGVPQSCLSDGVTPDAAEIELGEAAGVSQVAVRFVTPTELKAGAEIVARPEFGVLAARIRDRVSTLARVYGGVELGLDYRGFGERAEKVKMTRCDVRQVDVGRRSSRTGQRHSIGGFVGGAAYEGELDEFMPFLRAAKWTGVGRQTVWGKGEIEIAVPTST